MSGFPVEMREVLAPAVEATRAALKDMDGDEIPRKLRRVAAHSGGRLPPPLVKSVIDALDADEWLREKAADKLDDRFAGAAAAAFLDRQDGWWSVVAEEVAEQRMRAVAAASAESVAQVDELTAKLDVAKSRLKHAGAELDAERVRARRLAESDRVPRASDEEKKAKAGLKEAKAALAREADDRVEAEAMIARLRSRLKNVLRDQRRHRADRGESSELGADPIALAKSLDLLAAAAPHRHQREEAGDVEPAPVARLALPSGTRPDTVEAITWLLGSDEQVAVIVDGYNVLYNVDPATFTTSTSRRFLADQLARLRRTNGNLRAVVVYDSKLPGDREAQTLAGGVELHYSDEEEIADDKIVELADASALPVVVITSDRDLRQRSEAAGALTLWSESLVEWMGGR